MLRYLIQRIARSVRNKVKPDGEPLHSDPQQNERDKYERHISGDIYVLGEIEAKRPPDLTQEHNTERKEDKAHQNKKFVVEILTLITVAIYAGLTCWQGCSTKHAADAAAGAAKTAADELAVAKEIQSARLVVDKFDAKLIRDISNKNQVRIQVKLTIRNAGPTVANEIFIEKNGGSFDRRTVPAVYPPWKFDPALPLSSGRTLAPGGTFVYEPELPTSPKEGIAVGGRTVYFTVGISHRDIFGRPHIITECDWYSPITKPDWRPCYWNPSPKTPNPN
jgi:hypothetical protein